MKKITYYEFNDGIDGLMVAKSLKQAIKLIACKYCKHTTANVIVREIKKGRCNFILTDSMPFAKKGIYKKTKLFGMCD